MSIVKSLQKPHQVSCRSKDDEDVEHLVTAAKEVEGARSKSLRDSCCIDGRALEVQKSLQEQPPQAHPLVELGEAVKMESMQDGHDGREAHGGEHSSPEGAPVGGAETREDGHDCAASTDSRDPVIVISN